MFANRNLVEALEARRMLSAGDLDLSFGKHGVVTQSLGGEVLSMRLLVQPDHKVVVALHVKRSQPGTSQFILERFTTAGKLDRSFGKSGQAIRAVPTANTPGGVGPVIDGSGRILVSDGGDLMRFAASGHLDQRFGKSGIIRDFQTRDIAVRDDGKFFACIGRNVERFLSNGKLDTTFGKGGKVLMEFGLPTGPEITPLRPDYLAIQHDGSIIVAVIGGDALSGHTTPGIVRIRSSGKIDRTFGEHGLSLGHAYDFIESIAVLPGGKIAFTSGGEIGLDLLTVLDSKGRPDTAFNENGTEVINDVQGFFGASVSAQRDGKLIVDPFASEDDDGNDFMRLIRFNPDGHRDPGFGSDGQVVHAVALTTLAPNGDILLSRAKNNEFRLERIAGSPPAPFATLSGGTLTANGLSSDDEVTIEASTDGSKIVAELNGEIEKFDASKVQRVVVNGGRGDDLIIVKTALSTTLNGGAGKDTLWGGAGHDKLIGGAGNDEFHARDGQRDTLDGGEGYDKASRDHSQSVTDSVLDIELFV